MGNKIKININNLFEIDVISGTTVADIAYDYKKATNKCIMGAKINNSIVDFDTMLFENTEIEFFDYSTTEGYKIYQSGLKFIMIIAAKELWNKNVYFKYSLDKGIYATVDKTLKENDVLDLKIKMEEIVSYDFPIKRCVTRKNDAITYYLSTKDIEKANNIKNIPNRYVELYEINHSFNYFYSNMPYSTGELKLFNIELVDKNSIVLLSPSNKENKIISEFQYNDKIYNELLKYSKWAKKMNITYVDSINKLISESKIQSFIKMNNIFLNDSLYQIAKDVVKNKQQIKIILIGGPSSSGKTTSAHKLCTYLETFGIKPIAISADDYFKERIDTPKDQKGNYDFESLDAIDLNLFNKDLKNLLDGNEVIIPKYNFITGEKEFVREPIRMASDNVLVIEGLHCLNDKMTEKIDRQNKYKILVCPFTPLGLDKHNHLSTTDMRLIRRIVRDNRVRGNDVVETLKNWPNVKAGEDKYIYPYSYDLNGVLNTAYAYEVGVLKVYVEPLLYSVPMHSVYYEEARRLLGLLRCFYPISSEFIEDDNTLREFIGGSIYEK